jgi:DNA helicase II / ATP-dependent DNA helicase PcrA
MTGAHLEKLNDRQRSAVEHGVGLPLTKSPARYDHCRRCIGKTNALTHRVAH